MAAEADFENFRKEYSPDDNSKIEKCEIDIQLLDDLKRARYTYDCTFRTIGDRPEHEYVDVIPSAEELVRVEYVKDSQGGLEFTPAAEGREKTKLHIRFRHPVPKNEDYRLKFCYETNVSYVVTADFMSKSVSYTDWFIFDVQCDLLKVNVHLPTKSKPIKSFPAADLESNPISYDYEHMRPLDPFIFLLAYKRSGIGRRFWLWLGSAAGSGGIGALLSQLFG